MTQNTKAKTDYTKPSNEILVDEFNRQYGTCYTAEQFTFGHPTVGTIDYHNTDVVMKGKKDSGVKGTVLLHYNRLPINVITDGIDNGIFYRYGDKKVSDVLDQINYKFKIKLTPDDIEDADLPFLDPDDLKDIKDFPLTIKFNHLVFYGSMVLKLKHKPVDLNEYITETNLEGSFTKPCLIPIIPNESEFIKPEDLNETCKVYEVDKCDRDKNMHGDRLMKDECCNYDGPPRLPTSHLPIKNLIRLSFVRGDDRDFRVEFNDKANDGVPFLKENSTVNIDIISNKKRVGRLSTVDKSVTITSNNSFVMSFSSELTKHAKWKEAIFEIEVIIDGKRRTLARGTIDLMFDLTRNEG